MVEARGRGKVGGEATGALRGVLGGPAAPGGVGVRRLDSGIPTGWLLPVGDPGKGRERLQRAMTAGAGVLRDAASLARTAEELDAVCRPGDAPPATVAAAELANLSTLAAASARAAEARTESRGAHTRTDHPDPSGDLRVRLVQ
ncbi:MAG: hypothetical protein ACRDZY_13095, partial [Acidimicrobiales bacterium]